MFKRIWTAWLVALLPVAGCSEAREWWQGLGHKEERQLLVPAEPLVTRDVQWHDWSAIEQSNGLITMRHVPEAGARTLSLEIDGDDAFVVFPKHRGKVYPADSRDNSVHFGGHYTCIGPERIWNVHEQPFNGHAGPYQTSRTTDAPDRHGLRFTSLPDTWRGATISMEREITMTRGSTHVLVEEKVMNRGADPLEFYIWDFTQIDAAHPKDPNSLRRMSFYLPVPRKEGRKHYTSFFEPDPKMEAQFDESLPADVLAIHYKAQQFKVASHPEKWWVAAVDHDTGWTYVKEFDARDDAQYVDNNGPIEVYGSFLKDPMPQPFVEMELLTGIGRYLPGEAIKQKEHWYATICTGPVLEVTPVGVVCELPELSREGDRYDLLARFGVFYLGSVRLRVVDRLGETVFVDDPVAIDPRREFKFAATFPASADAKEVVLEVYDYQGKKAGELAREFLR